MWGSLQLVSVVEFYSSRVFVIVQEEQKAGAALKELKRREQKMNAHRSRPPPMPGDDAFRQEVERQQENVAYRKAYEQHIVGRT